jgi:hypothetical protein
MRAPETDVRIKPTFGNDALALTAHHLRATFASLDPAVLVWFGLVWFGLVW